MGGKTILIIDDDEVLLKLAERDLSGAGYKVFTAATGQEGVTLAKTCLPNLILLDIFLPDIDGGEVESMLKDDPATREIPVLYLSALLRKEEEKRLGRVKGGNVIIAKPYNFENLLAEIKTRI